MEYEIFTKNFGQLPRQFLTGESNQVCSGYHGNVVESEDPFMKLWSGKMNGYGGRDEWPEHVDRQRGFATAAEAYLQELHWMYALPTTFTIRMDVFCDLVPIMIDPVSFMVDPMPFMIEEVIFLAGVFRLSVVEFDILLDGPSSLVFASIST